MPRNDDYLKQNLARLEILDGLQIAYDRRSELMTIVGDSLSYDDAQSALQAAWGLSYVQASCVLDLPIRRFSQEGREHLLDERIVLKRVVDEP